MCAAAFMAFAPSHAALGQDLQLAAVTPAEISPELQSEWLRPAYTGPQLTNALLAAYVERQQELKDFNAFDVPAPRLTEEVLLSYIERHETNGALSAIDSFATLPALTDQVLETYAIKAFVPTAKKVKIAKSEQLCLTQAIYHEARGESTQGQWAVANVIINRALSNKFPTTLCGVVYQNAELGYHRCQFTFACDGKSDMGLERGAWSRAVKIASAAYQDFRLGETPGVIPNSALYYHTLSVSPSWSNSFRPVATIGAHIFYASN